MGRQVTSVLWLLLWAACACAELDGPVTTASEAAPSDVQTALVGDTGTDALARPPFDSLPFDVADNSPDIVRNNSHVVAQDAPRGIGLDGVVEVADGAQGAADDSVLVSDTPDDLCTGSDSCDASPTGSDSSSQTEISTGSDSWPDSWAFLRPKHEKAQKFVWPLAPLSPAPPSLPGLLPP